MLQRGAARHQDFDARLAVFFEQDDVPTALGRGDSGHQPRRSGSDHRDVVVRGHSGEILTGTRASLSIGG